jgi:hypothetical protein
MQFDGLRRLEGLLVFHFGNGEMSREAYACIESKLPKGAFFLVVPGAGDRE